MSRESSRSDDGGDECRSAPSQLAELLARVEAAEGPDRELDRSIAKAFGWKRIALDQWKAGERLRGQRPEDGLKRAIPEYTASLDAVLALAHRLGFYIRSEPRFHVDGERVDYISHALRPRWSDWRPDDEWFDRGEARHADQVLSVVAALLRVLIAHQETPQAEREEPREEEI